MKLKNRLRKISNHARTARKAFTMIELVVVMAVIAILVLLAMPWFVDRTADARLTQAMNDAKVIENGIDEYLLHHETLNPRLTLEDKARLESLIGDGRLADKGGLAEGLDGGDYFIVPDDFIQIDLNIKKPGKDDVYSSDNGHVVIDLESEEHVIEDETPGSVPIEAKTSIPIGDGTESNPYQLWYVEHYDYIRNDLNKHFIAMRSLDFNNPEDYLDSATNLPLFTTGLGWNPISGPSPTFFSPIEQIFSGVLDGQSYSLSNLYMDRREGVANGRGLFAYMRNATIKNFTLSGDIKANANVGILAGGAYDTTVDSVHISGTALGENNNVGGMFGIAEGTTYIDNSSVDADVETLLYDTGGLVGKAGILKVTNTTTAGTVKAARATSVQAPSSAGGMVGFLQYTGSRITNSSSSSDVTATGRQVGGLVGKMDFGIITDSHATGTVVSNITDKGQGIGGLVGDTYNGQVINSYATGNVTGYSRVGGLIGAYKGTTIAPECYATGIVTGYGLNVGQLLGGSYSTFY